MLAHQEVICYWIRAGHILGIFIAFPCATWSKANTRPLRFNWCLNGRPVLSPQNRMKVANGNTTFQAACFFIR